MKTKRFFVFGLPAALLALGLALAGCESPTGGERGENPPSGALSTDWTESQWQSWFKSHATTDSSALNALKEFADENLAWVANNPWWYDLVKDWDSGGKVSDVLPAPTGVSATAQSSNSISVSWNYVSGASGYRVYRSDSPYGYYSELRTAYGNIYTDTGLSPNTTYYYKVSAWNDYGESSQSYYTSATTPDPGDGKGDEPYAPAIPTGLTATAQSSDSIYVSWDSVSGASSYRVYRSDSSYGYYSELASTYDACYTDTGLSPNTAYYYKVSAYNDAGGSEQSYYTSATTPVVVPTGVTATAQSSSSVYVSWTYTSGSSSYYVYRASSSEGYYSYHTSTSNTYYTDTGLSPNTTYYYKVSAGSGSNAQSDYVSVTTFVSAPTGVTASSESSSSVSVSWYSVSGASGYRVYRAAGSSGDYALISGNLSTTSYTDTGCSASTTYYYKVSAYTNAGEGAQSSYASATTFLSTPTGVTASAESPSSIYVSWEQVSGISSYRVYRASSSDGYYAPLGSTSNTYYTDTGLSPNTLYYYKVRAYNNGRESDLSSYASARTLPTPGTLSITVGFNLGAITITSSDSANTIRQTTGSPQTLTLSAEGYDNVAWYVDGDTSAPTSGNTITIDALNYETKLHSVTFTGYKNGTPYAQAIPFTVLY